MSDFGEENNGGLNSRRMSAPGAFSNTRGNRGTGKRGGYSFESNINRGGKSPRGLRGGKSPRGMRGGKSPRGMRGGHHASGSNELSQTISSTVYKHTRSNKHDEEKNITQEENGQFEDKASEKETSEYTDETPLGTETEETGEYTDETQLGNKTEETGEYTDETQLGNKTEESGDGCVNNKGKQNLAITQNEEIKEKTENETSELSRQYSTWAMGAAYNAYFEGMCQSAYYANAQMYQSLANDGKDFQKFSSMQQQSGVAAPNLQYHMNHSVGNLTGLTPNTTQQPPPRQQQQQIIDPTLNYPMNYPGKNVTSDVENTGHQTPATQQLSNVAAGAMQFQLSNPGVDLNTGQQSQTRVLDAGTNHGLPDGYMHGQMQNLHRLPPPLPPQKYESTVVRSNQEQFNSMHNVSQMPLPQQHPPGVQYQQQHQPNGNFYAPIGIPHHGIYQQSLPLHEQINHGNIYPPSSSSRSSNEKVEFNATQPSKSNTQKRIGKFQSSRGGKKSFNRGGKMSTSGHQGKRTGGIHHFIDKKIKEEVDKVLGSKQTAVNNPPPAMPPPANYPPPGMLPTVNYPPPTVNYQPPAMPPAGNYPPPVMPYYTAPPPYSPYSGYPGYPYYPQKFQ